MVARVRLCLIFMSGALVVGCRRSRSPIVLDDWWNIDYARNACEMGALKDEPACLDPQRTVLSYEDQVESAFAAEPECNGLVLTHFAGPLGTKLGADAMASKNGNGWQLMIDFIPGDRGSIGWSMASIGHGDHVLSQNARSPRQLARDACRIVRHVGGAVN